MAKQSLSDLTELYNIVLQSIEKLQCISKISLNKKPTIKFIELTERKFENLKRNCHNMFEFSKYMTIFGYDWKKKAQNCQIESLSLKRELSSTIEQLMDLQNSNQKLSAQITYKQNEIQQIKAVKGIDITSIKSIRLKKSTSFTFDFSNQIENNINQYPHMKESNKTNQNYNTSNFDDELMKMPQLKNTPMGSGQLLMDSISSRKFRDLQFKNTNQFDIDSSQRIEIPGNT